MTPDYLRTLLRSTLDDLKVSRGERQSLSATLRDDPPTEAQWAEFRAIAFGIARESVGEALRPADVLNWLEEVIQLLTPRVDSSAGSCSGDVCFSPGEACRDRIAGLLRTAKQTVDVCVFTVTDNVIAEELLDAHRRGVRVRIITDDRKSGDRGSDIRRFEAAGIPVRIDRTKHHMHHKFAIFDGRRLVTGSYNWTVGAAFDNEEHIVILGDTALIDRFEAEFERLWDSYR